MKDLDRRNFLKLAGSTTLGVLASQLAAPLSGFAALDDELSDHFFVVVQMQGGWDVTLGLDPWRNPILPDSADMFIEYSTSELLRRGNINLGPSATPLSPFADRMAVINGIFLNDSDNGHEAALNYMLTGRGSNAANIEVELAHASSTTGNFGIITNGSVNTHIRNIAVTDLNGVESAYSDRKDGSSFASFLAANNPKTPLAIAQNQMATSSHKMRDLFKALDSLNINEEESLKDAKILAASFLSRTAFSGNLELDGEDSLDSHSNHEGAHLRAQKERWEGLAKTLNLFKNTPYHSTGESLLDRTTFLVVSDFSRTAALNSAKGKDHNPMTNSAVLIGRGINGGTTFGESKLITAKESRTGKSYHIAKPFDFDTARPIEENIPGSKFITPENIAMSLASLYKVDMNKFKSIPSDFRVIPGLLK